MQKKMVSITLITLLITSLFSFGVFAESQQEIRIAFFEGGDSPAHSLMRNEFMRILKEIAPDKYEIIYTPHGFKTAQWNRDSCKIMAGELANLKNIDIICTFGPWVVEDLLESGCKKPIVAMHRIDPFFEEIVDKNLKPIAENLTVQVKPWKIENDILTYYKLHNFKKLGVLCFSTGNEKEKILEIFTKAGEKLNFEVVSVDEYDNRGTFAFFKTYNELKKQNIDAVYLFPLWGMDLVKMGEFVKRITTDKIPAFTYEGNTPVQKGALASNGTLSFISDARYNAEKVIQIIEGTKPQDLEIEFSERPILVINEETAKKCGVEISRKYYHEADILTPPPSEDITAMTLHEAALLSTSQNPKTLASLEKITSAKAAQSQSKSVFLPHLDLNASAFHNDNNTINNSHDWLDQDGYDATISIEQQIFSLPSSKDIKYYAEKIKLAESSHEEIKMDLELATTLAYIDLIQTQEEYALQKQNREHLTLYLELSKLLYQFTDKDTVDIIRWDNEWFAATSKLINSRYKQLASELVLKSLLNLPPDYELVIDSSGLTSNMMFDEYKRLYEFTSSKIDQIDFLNYLINEAKINHPKRNTLKINIQLVKHLLNKNGTFRTPELKVRAGYTFADRMKDYPPAFEEKHNSWTILGKISLPLFNGKYYSYEKKKLEAQLNEAEYLHDDISLDIMKAMADYFYKMLSHTDQMPSAYLFQSNARTSLEIILRKYEKNEASFLDLLDAQQNAYRAELNIIQNKYDYYRNLAKITNLMGLSMVDGYQNFNTLFINKVAGYSNN